MEQTHFMKFDSYFSGCQWISTRICPGHQGAGDYDCGIQEYICRDFSKSKSGDYSCTEHADKQSNAFSVGWYTEGNFISMWFLFVYLCNSLYLFYYFCIQSTSVQECKPRRNEDHSNSTRFELCESTKCVHCRVPK